MAYDIYFDKVLLPVAPSKIKTKIKNKNKTIELINEGEVNLLKDAGLTELSFSVLLPNMRYPFARYNNGVFQNASYYLGILEQYKRNKQPFRFIVSRTLPNGSVLFYTNLMVSIEDYDFEDDASNGFDIKATINLKQYKDYGTKTVNIPKNAKGNKKKKSTKKRADGEKAKNTGKKYTIVSGDTLWNIAKKKLGNGSKWKDLYDSNKKVIEDAAKKRGRASSSNGHWIYPGTQITIP